ncbi:MAG: CoA transferase subunit A [Deltaproteobacteria bacterium]|nr:CoA transferase subunit A [Deltaproteobacteria bacterium]
MASAVARLVRPGDQVVISSALEGFIPYAACHEVIRQGIGPLTLVAPISNISADQLIAAGLVEGIIAAWVGNVSTGVGYNFRRAVEEGLPRPLQMIDHTNFSITLALEAGARGLPMAVSTSPLGSDIARDNPHFRPFTCPHTGQRLLAVKALNPDVALLHVQRADPQGNCHLWGASGFTRYAAQASRRVLITCEEIVAPEVIRADPDRTMIPGLLVDAVCEVPWAGHPAPVLGYYDLDNQFFLDYAAATREPAGARAWLEEWVYGVPDRAAYLQKLGLERARGLRVSHPAPSHPVEYGW